jgi:quinol monooxygenase YgiN
VLIIAGHARIKPEAREEAIAAATEMQRLSSAESGCQEYGFWFAVDDPDKLLLFERWDDLSALEAHRQEPHFAEFGSRLGGFVDGPVELLRYEAEPGEF